MHDPLLVRFLQSLRDLTGDRGGLAFGEGPVGDHLGHRPAGDVLHHEEVQVVLAVEIEDGRDVRMVELGERQGLAPETLARRFARERAGGQHLQRHVAPQALVAGAVHNAHASRADNLDDAVMGQRSTDHHRSL